MCYQLTELPPSIFQRKQKNISSLGKIHTSSSITMMKNRGQSVHKKYEVHANPERCTKCGDSQHIDSFRCPASRHQCRNCHKYGHFSSLCYKKKEAFDKKRSLESRSPEAHQLRLVQSICKIPYVASLKIYPQVKIHSACNSNCSLHKLRPRSSTTSYYKFSLQAKASQEDPVFEG